MNKLVSSLVLIDQKRPVFDDMIVQEEVGDFAEEIKQEMRNEEKMLGASNHQNHSSNDDLKNYYFIQSNNLMKKSVGKKNKVTTSKVIGVDNFF